MREAGHGVPLGERGDLAPPSVRHGGDELLHGAAAAHRPDDEVRRAGAVDRARRVRVRVRALRGGVAHAGGRRGRGLRERELGLGDLVELLLGQRGRPAELLDDASDAAARGAGVGVGGGGRSRVGGSGAGARRDGADGLDLAPALDERRGPGPRGRELGGRAGCARGGEGGVGGRGGGVGGRRGRLPEDGGARGDGARGGGELGQLCVPGAAGLVGGLRRGAGRDGGGRGGPSVEDLAAAPGRGLAGGGGGGGGAPGGGGVRGGGGDEDVEEAPGRGGTGGVPP